MGVVKKVIRLFWLYVTAVIGAATLSLGVYILWLLTYGLHRFSLPIAINLSCFLALPFGSVLGMYFMDKWLYESPKYLVQRILTAFLMSVGGFVSIVIAVTQAQRTILLSPPAHALFLYPCIIAFFSLIGYQLTGLLKKGMAQVLLDNEVSPAKGDKSDEREK
jgi:hypothetical protein